jgi:hypothetical protein
MKRHRNIKKWSYELFSDPLELFHMRCVAIIYHIPQTRLKNTLNGAVRTISDFLRQHLHDVLAIADSPFIIRNDYIKNLDLYFG